METPIDSSRTKTGLGIIVEGELNDFQIIEEISDDDHDDGRTVGTRSTDSLSVVPSSVLRPPISPICGDVAVNNSENVVIGNNTYFNGPVTIKQVIQSNGVENLSYVKTEDDDLPPHAHRQSQPKAIQKFHVQQWHKVLISCIICIVVAVILAILTMILNNTRQEDSSPNVTEEQADKAKKNMVVVWWMGNIICIIITTITTLFAFLLMCYFIIKLDGWCLDNNVTTMSKYRSKEECANQDYCNACLPYTDKDPLLIAADHLRIVSRTDWLAQPPTGQLDKIRQPVPWVIITHSATEYCSTQSECVLRVRLIQNFHVESRKWFDIGYNFLVGGDGSAYMGRGWDSIGAHTLGYNKYSIGIAFIGTFSQEAPPKKQIDACLRLIKSGVKSGKLAKDYKLFAHRQLASTTSPGDKLFEIMKGWPHFVNNVTDVNELVPDY